MFKPDDVLFPGGQRYGDYHDEVLDAPYTTAHHATDHRGRKIHAGRRTVESMRRAMSTDSMARGMATGAAIGGALGGMVTINPMMHGTVGEFLDPSRIASGVPGAVAGAAIGAASAYGLRKKLGD